MVQLRHRSLLAGLTAASLLLALALAPATLAHAGSTVGDFLVEAGWRDEPPVLGHANAVQVTITRHDDDTPVTDLGAGDLTVVVSGAGSNGSPLSLVPAFDPAAGTGPLGTYEAAIVPTAAGAASFHITGSIHATPVDVTVEGGVVETSSPVDTEPAPGLDPLLVAGVVALVVVVAAMAFLLFRVRPAQAGPSGRGRPDG